MDYKALLIKSLGLGDDATDEAIQAALEARKDAGGDARQPEKKEEQEAAISEAVAKAVAEAVKPIADQVAALSASAEAHEKQDLIAAAAREGKVIALSAEALAKIGVDDLKATIAKTAVTVPLSARTPATVRDTAGGEVSEELRQIALNCGVDPECLKNK